MTTYKTLQSDYFKITIAAVFATVVGRFISVPLIELFTAAFLVVIANKYFSTQVKMPGSGLAFVQIVLGMSAGATVSFADLMTTIHPVLLLGLVGCVFIQTSSNFLWLTRREGWTPFESILGAVPGAMAAILVISEAQSSPSARVVYSHSIRLLLLVVLAGVISSSHGGAAHHNVMPDGLGIAAILLVAGLTVIVGVVTGKLGLRAPFMVSALLVTAFYNGTIQFTSVIIPIVLVKFALALLGVMIGSRLATTTLRQALSYAKAGFIVTGIGLIVSVIFALLWSEFTNLNWLILLLAWVPGSVEAMTAVALLLGLEPAFVMVNHSLRIMMLYLLPVVFKQRLEQLQQQSEP